MVWHNNYTLKKIKWVNICVNKNINSHSYVINIHSFDPIFICGVHAQEVKSKVYFNAAIIVSFPNWKKRGKGVLWPHTFSSFFKRSSILWL
jgi:hypothetical protein